MNEKSKLNTFISTHPWLIIPFVLLMGYVVFNQLVDIKKSKMNTWKNSDRNVLIKNCLTEMKEKAIIEPIISNDYCKCSSDKLMNTFSLSEYTDIIGKSIEEQKELMIPVFQDCLDIYVSKTQLSKSSLSE